MNIASKLLAGALCALSLAAGAQGRWPDRPIKIVVPSAAGGAADFAARVFQRHIQKEVPGAVVLVEDRPGAGGIIGTEAVKNAAPDGYTFLIATNSTHAANSSLYRKLPYDPVRDFEPVGMFGTFATIAMVQRSSPYKTLPDLIDQAKARPGQLFFGYYSSSSRVPPELLKARTKISAQGVAYKNITQIITDLIGGQVQFAFLDSLSAAPALQNNQLMPIAVTSLKRMTQLPNVPTVAEVLPGYEVEGWLGLAAPARTPRDIVERVGALTRGTVADAEARAALERQGMTPVAMTPDALRAHIAADRTRWAEWVKAAGIEPE